MHNPPKELNENNYWLGLKPEDLLGLACIAVVVLAVLRALGVVWLVVPIFLPIFYLIYSIRRNKRKKFMRDRILNFFEHEGVINDK